MPPDKSTSSEPDYGPRGYLPPRAAKRARKIILREPMGLQWAVAAVVAGVVVLAAGGVLFLLRSGPPGPPFVAVGEIARVDPRGAATLPLGGGREVLVLRGAGGVAVFDDPPAAVEWCAGRSRLIAAGSAVWEPDGRLVGGTGESLARLPAQVHDGVLHVDAESAGTRRAPLDRDEPTACAPAP
ncbi:hypothetical protein BH23ACT10_BH23ACT10_02610 [soil metagenome]